MDINTGTWVRILPSGDPGSSGSITFPTPREGAAGLSFSQALVGNSRNNSADTIVNIDIFYSSGDRANF